MKRIIKNIFIAAFAILTSTSCESYFDSVPSDTISLDAVFSNRGLTLQWLSNVYSYLPDETSQNYSAVTRGIWTPASLEAKLPWDQCNSNHVTGGTLYPSTGYVEDMWRNYYRGIQKANVYIQNVDRCTPMSEKERAWSKAEVRALRGIYYFNLFKIYGPFVIIDNEVFDVEGDIDAMMHTRSSVDECVDYIIGEFDAVLREGNLLSHFNDKGAVNSDFWGNITREAVEAIRSEVLLYAASYLFNGDPYYKGLKNQDGKNLFPQSESLEKWELAKEAAKNFMDNNPGFQLVYRDKTGSRVTGVVGSCPFNSANRAALGMRDNEEMIFYRSGGDWNILYTMTPKHSGITDANSGAGALAAPLQMVDLYFTNNGLRIEDDPKYFTYDTEAPGIARTMTSVTEYKDKFSGYSYFKPSSDYRIMNQFYNREPRFYIAFTFQGRKWDFDNSKTYYTDFSLNGNSGRARNGHDYPKSGVLARKKLKGSLDVPFFIYIRLSEIYLNYAEACNECGEIGEAIKYVNLIRSRAGVAEYKGLLAGDVTPTDVRGENRIVIPLDQQSVRNVIRRERLIELAYENQRYFDVRRWGVAGMEQGDGWIYPSWHKGGEGGNMVGFDVEIDMAKDTKDNPMDFYKRVEWEKRIYTKRMSLFPIPQTEINRNPMIVQNTGWETK